VNLRSAILFNYAAQIYAAIAMLFVAPMYLNLMGAEGYGLVGFFIMLQGFIQILDAGVSGSVTRLVSTSKQDATTFNHALLGFRKINLVFIGLGLAVITYGSVFKTGIALEWLDSDLEKDTLVISILGIFFCLGFRFMAAPYRAALVGLERHKLISTISVIINSLKFPISVLYLKFVDDNAGTFFLYQAAVTLLEMLAFWAAFRVSCSDEARSLRQVGSSKVTADTALSLRSVINFSGVLSALSICWVLVSQIDKLTLSRYISLSDYGFYSLAVTLSGSILMLAAPLNQILTPMMSRLATSKDYEQLSKVFFTSLIGIAVVGVPLALFFFFFGRQTIFVWTGSTESALAASSYLGYLAVGNTVSLFLNMVFLIQFAFGAITRHMQLYLIYSIFLVPITILVASSFGGVGTSILWSVHNTVFFIFWGLYVINRYFEDGALIFVLNLFLPVLCLSSLHFYISSEYFTLLHELDRATLGVSLFFVGVSNSLLCAIFLYYVRSSRKLIETRMYHTTRRFA
jgi:O-antigen/teichoic acid export membrane protein